MTENKQQFERKKTRLIWRIFRWIGLTVLILLLIASVFYQAPWKIITLLAIVLAACTILPKPYRKWFWLSVGAVIIVLIIWVFLPDDNEDWRPYMFDKELVELETKYAISDEQNAAFSYVEIFENLDVDSNQPEFYVYSSPSSKDEPWLSKDHPETAEWLKGHQDTIEKLIKTAKKDKCLFIPINADLFGYSDNMEDLSKVRQCAFLLVSVANNDVAEGRINAAIEKYFCVIRMANHMYQQLTMIQHLTGHGIESLALNRLNRLVIEGRPELEHFLLIADSMIGIENDWDTYWPRVLDFEKLYTKNLHGSMFYEINTKGKTRLTRDSVAQWRKQFPQDVPPLTYSQRKLNKAKTILQWFGSISSPEEMAEIIDAGFEQYYAMVDPDYDWIKEPEKWNMVSFISIGSRRVRFNFKYVIQTLIDMSEESYYNHHELYVKNLALRRGSRLLVAIKQYHIEHGTWPDSLDAIKSNVPAEALIDPATGKDFEYENHGQRFSLFAESVNIWPK